MIETIALIVAALAACVIASMLLEAERKMFEVWVHFSDGTKATLTENNTKVRFVRSSGSAEIDIQELEAAMEIFRLLISRSA